MAGYIQKMECPKCHRMVQTWTHIENCLGKEHSNKNYGVMASGHGSKFVLDKLANGATKPYTFRGAIESARRWESIADTIGGQAKVIDLTTKQVLQHH